MEALLRTRVSMFSIEESLTLAQIEEYAAAGTLTERILPIEACFKELPMRKAKESGDRLLHNGNLVFEDQLEEQRPKTACFEDVRMYDSQGIFIGVYQSDGQGGWKPKKMFYYSGG